MPYFDELLKVTELYVTYAERSSNYEQLPVLLKSIVRDREMRYGTHADVPHRSLSSLPARVS